MSASFVEEAKELAEKVYGNSIDECGYPVLRRLQWDAEQFSDDDCRCAAYLQGIFHKTGKRMMQYMAEGYAFPMRSGYAAELLYYDDSMSLSEYLDRALTHDYASAVLLADLQYRMNLANYTDQGADSFRKSRMYHNAYIYTLQQIEVKYPQVLSFFKTVPVIS